MLSIFESKVTGRLIHNTAAVRRVICQALLTGTVELLGLYSP